MSTQIQSTIFSPDGLRLTRTTLLGSMLGAAAYGTAASLYFLILYLRIYPRRTQGNTDTRAQRVQNIFLTVHTSIMFVLITIIISSHGSKLWNFFPATPDGLFDDRFITEEGIGHMGTFASFVNNWMADALLIWRVYVLFKTDSRYLRVVVVSTLSCMLFVAIVLSTIQLARIYKYEVVTTSIAFFLTISLNVLGTGIIVTRLLMHRYRTVRVLGAKQGTCYTNLAAILMESAALVVVFDSFFAVTFITGGPLFNLTSEIIGHIQAIGSFLIIYRILQGKVYSSATGTSDSTRSTKHLIFEIDSGEKGYDLM